MDGVSRGLERVLSRPFLLQCLTDTGLEADIVEDIADVCEAHELSALSLAKQELPLKEASDKLFLTNREVEVLFEVCKELCLKEGVSLDDKEVESPPPEPVKYVVEAARGTPVAASPTRSCGAFSVGRLSVDGVDAYSVGKLSVEGADDHALTVDTDSCDSCGEEEIEAVQVGREGAAEEWVDRVVAARSLEHGRDRVREAPWESPFTDDGNKSPFRSLADRCPFSRDDEEPSEPAVVDDAPLEAEDSYVGEREEYRPLSLNAEDLAEEEYVPTGSTDSCIISELEAQLDHVAVAEEALPTGDPSTPCSIGQLVAVQSFQGAPSKESTSTAAQDKPHEEPCDGRPPRCPGSTHRAPLAADTEDYCASEGLDEVPPSLSEFGEDFLRTGGTERGASELSTCELDLVEIGRESTSRRVVQDNEALQLDLSGVVAKEPRRAEPETGSGRPSVPCNRAPTPFPAESARTKKRRDALALGHVLLRAQGAGLDLDLEEDITTAPGGQECGPKQDAVQGEAVTRGDGGEVCSSTYQPDSKALLAVRAPGLAGGLPRSAPVPRKVGEGLMVRTGANSSEQEDASSPQSGGSPTAAHVVVNTKMPRRPMTSAVPAVEQQSFEERNCAYRSAFDGGSRCVESREPEAAAECAKKSHSLEAVCGKESLSSARGSFEGYEFSCPANFIPKGPTTPDVEDVECTPVRMRGERDRTAIPLDRGQMDSLPSNSDSVASKMSKLAMKQKDAGGLCAIDSSNSRTEEGLQQSGKVDVAVCGDRRSLIPRTVRVTATSAGTEGVTSVAMEEKEDLLQWFEDPPMARPVAPKPMSIRRSHRSATATQDKRALIHSAPAEQEDRVHSPVALRKESMVPMRVNASEKPSLYQVRSDYAALNAGPCVKEEKIITPVDVCVDEEKIVTPMEVFFKEKEVIAPVAVREKKEMSSAPMLALHTSVLPWVESSRVAAGFEDSCLVGDGLPQVEAGRDTVKDSTPAPGVSDVAVEVQERRGIGRMMMKESVAVRESEASGQKPRGLLPRMSSGGFALEKKDDSTAETPVDGAGRPGVIHTKIPTQPVRPGGAAVKGIMLSTEARRSAAVAHTHGQREKAVPKTIDSTKKMVQQCSAKVVAVRSEPVAATVGVVPKENVLPKAAEPKRQRCAVEDTNRIIEQELATATSMSKENMMPEPVNKQTEAAACAIGSGDQISASSMPASKESGSLLCSEPTKELWAHADAAADRKTKVATAITVVKKESTVVKIAEAAERLKVTTDAGDGAEHVILPKENGIPKTTQASKAVNAQPDVVANGVKEREVAAVSKVVASPEIANPAKLVTPGGDPSAGRVARKEKAAVMAGMEVTVPELVEAPKPLKIRKQSTASGGDSKVDGVTCATAANRDTAATKVVEVPKLANAEDRLAPGEKERRAESVELAGVSGIEIAIPEFVEAPKPLKIQKRTSAGRHERKVENTETAASVTVASKEIAFSKVREPSKVVDADDHPLHSEMERNTEAAAPLAFAREESVSSKVAEAPKAQKTWRHAAASEAEGKVGAVTTAEIAGRGSANSKVVTSKTVKVQRQADGSLAKKKVSTAAASSPGIKSKDGASSSVARVTKHGKPQSDAIGFDVKESVAGSSEDAAPEEVQRDRPDVTAVGTVQNESTTSDVPEASKETAIRASTPESTEDKKPAAAVASMKKDAILPMQVSPRSSETEKPHSLPTEAFAVQTGTVWQDSKESAKATNHRRNCMSANSDDEEVALLGVPVETGVAESPLVARASLEVGVLKASSPVQGDRNYSKKEGPLEKIVSSHPVEVEDVEDKALHAAPTNVVESEIFHGVCTKAQQPVAISLLREGSAAATSAQTVSAGFAPGPEVPAATTTSAPNTAVTGKDLASSGDSGEGKNALTQESGTSARVTNSTEGMHRVECMPMSNDRCQSAREEAGKGKIDCVPKMGTQPTSTKSLIYSSAKASVADSTELASACGVASAEEEVIPPGDEQWLKEQTDAVLKRLEIPASSPRVRPGVGRRMLPGMWEDGDHTRKRSSKNVRGGRTARVEARPAFDSRPVRKPGLFNPSEDDIPGARRRRDAAIAGEPEELHHAAMPSAASMRPALTHMPMMHSQPVRTAPVHTAVHGPPKRTPSQVAAVRATPTRTATTRTSTLGGGTSGTRGGRTAGASRAGPARSTLTRASSGYERRESLIPKSSKIPQVMNMQIVVTAEAGSRQVGETKTSGRGLPTPVAQALRRQKTQGEMSPEVRNRSPKPAKPTPGKEPASIRALLKRDAASSFGTSSKKPSSGKDPKAVKSLKKTSQPRAPGFSPSIPRCAQTASRKNTLSPVAGSNRPKSRTATLAQLRTAPNRKKERASSKCSLASRSSVSCSKKMEAEKEVQGTRRTPQRAGTATSTAGWQPPVPQRVRPSQARPQQPEKRVRSTGKGVRAPPEEVYYCQVKEAEATKKRQSQVKTKTTTTRTSTGTSVSRSAGHRMERHVSVERHERSKVQVTRTVVKTYTERKQGSKVIREREEKITRVSTPPRVPQYMKATVAHSPKLASAARAHHWKEVIDPKKHEKMEDLQKKQEEKKAKELEARDRVVKWTRESIIFKTDDLPDFGECLEGDMEAAALDAMDHDELDEDDMGHDGMDPDDMDEDVPIN